MPGGLDIYVYQNGLDVLHTEATTIRGCIDTEPVDFASAVSGTLGIKVFGVGVCFPSPLPAASSPPPRLSTAPGSPTATAAGGRSPTTLTLAS